MEELAVKLFIYIYIKIVYILKQLLKECITMYYVAK